MRIHLCICFLLFSFTASADFLIVSRNGNMRAEASTDSEILERIHTGDTLILIDDIKTNSYWHVRGKASGQEGWVYQNLVRRIAGDIEAAPVDDDNSVVDIRILDVGAGHSALIKLPGDKFVIYDAGGSDKLQNGSLTFGQITEYIPIGSTIELLVLSHTDADHINAAQQVIRDYNVKKVLWTGYEAKMAGGTQTGSYRRLRDILPLRPQTENVNLNAKDSIITPGNSFSIGSAKFTFLCGFGKPHIDWQSLDKSEKLNGVSIVMKLEFKGNSVLFTGDAVGRHLNDPPDALIATEHYLVNNAASLLPSKILIAPHHGARNGSSAAFVDLVKPEWVIFSSGHEYLHPTTRTANVYLQYTTTDKILRTDRGDDEGVGEWSYGRKQNCQDPRGDDTIQIQLRGNGTFRVYYMNEINPPCRN